MKLLILILVFIVVEAESIDCNNQSNSTTVAKNVNKIKNEYINSIARQIFNDETGIYDFIGIDCKKSTETKQGLWNCFIMQIATKFENGKYTVNPPHVGEWLLTINFNNNTYHLKK
jgi:hypothetical protein